MYRFFSHYMFEVVMAVICLVMLSGCQKQGPSELEQARDSGISLMAAGEYEAAVSAFEQAYQLCDDKMPDTKMDISLYEAACQFRLEDYAQVRDVCSRALNFKDHADAYYLRGASFLKLGETDAAKADFDAASVLAPGDYGMFLNIYMQYEEQNLSAVGDEYLQKALNNDSWEMEDYYQKGSIYFYLRDYPMAQKMLAKPTEAKHKNAMMLMGQVYLKLDDSTHARNIFRQYLEEYGSDANAYNGIVLCELADGNYDAAVSMAREGLALETEDETVRRDLLYNEIVAYERKYDFASALAAAEQFVGQYPDDKAGKKEYAFLSSR